MNGYEKSWAKASRLAEEAGVKVAWRQWVALGSYARPATERTIEKVVDPEALILLSLTFREREGRLADIVRWWANAGSGWTNVQRMRTLADQLGSESPSRFELFARWASDSGHRSWKRYASRLEDPSSPPKRHPPKGPETLRLIEPSTLMVRMRAAFGVGAKSDVLTFLIGLRGTMATVSVISRAVGYTETAVRAALKDMAMARLVHETRNRPASYGTTHRPWIDLMEMDFPRPVGRGIGPGWGMWPPLFGVLIHARRLGELAAVGRTNEYSLASSARDVVEGFRYAFDFHHISVPDLDRYRGRDFASAFVLVVESLAGWLEQNA